jgi:O-antigen ligase
VTRLLRLLIGAALAWYVVLVVRAPETGMAADLAVSLFVVQLAALRPAYGLAALLILAPFGALLAPTPAHIAELLAWTLVAIALLTTWRRPAEGPVAGRPEIQTPAWLFAACVVASWCGLMIAGAAGVVPGAIPRLLVYAIGPDYFIFSSPQPETWTMLQVAAGLAVFWTAVRVAAADRDAPRITAWALVASGVVLAVATEADVLRQWALQGYGGWFLERYVQGERFSLHLADLNAAGSQYVLAGLAAAALAATDCARRSIWVAAVVVMLPALWLTGSRSAALGAILVGATVIPLGLRRVRAAVMPAGAAAIVLVAVTTVGATIAAARQPAEPGSAMSALRMRSQFLVTSARMFASAPVFGVGVGRYHERSAEFMPPSLRAVYPFENAHNYFAQQFAELGLIGGALFVWLVAAGLRAGWKALTARQSSAAALALLAGCIGYLLTCVTGHPLLVPEAALPFWAVFGALVGSSIQPAAAAAPRFSRTIVVALVIVLLAGGVVLQGRRYASVTAPPSERGFHASETSGDGVPFNWMTRHGIFYIGSQPGFLVIPVRAPDLPGPRFRPFVVDIDVGGWRIGSYELEPGRWHDIRVALRDRARTPFRRVDMRANQQWTRRRDLGIREADDEPRSVMVGGVRWQPPGAR